MSDVTASLPHRPMTERAEILSFLRHLAATARGPVEKGCYLYAADEIERGEHLKAGKVGNGQEDG